MDLNNVVCFDRKARYKLCRAARLSFKFISFQLLENRAYIRHVLGTFSCCWLSDAVEFRSSLYRGLFVFYLLLFSQFFVAL